MFFWFIHGVPYENGLKHVSGRRRAGHFKTMRYGKWTRWCTAGMLVLLAGCTAEEWAQFSKEMEENQRAAAERRATYHNISVQCSDWDMRGTATAGLSAKGFRVMYPGEGDYGAVVAVNKTAEEHTLIRKGLYFVSTPGPDTRPGYKTKVTVTVHDLNGKKLAEYQGESSPGSPTTVPRRRAPPAARQFPECPPAALFIGKGARLFVKVTAGIRVMPGFRFYVFCGTGFYRPACRSIPGQH